MLKVPNLNSALPDKEWNVKTNNSQTDAANVTYMGPRSGYLNISSEAVTRT